MKFPPYYGWSHYMGKKPGEDSIVYVRRVFIWDQIVEGQIKFS
jgi:hypothetical protein